MFRALWWIVAAGVVIASCAATDGFSLGEDDPVEPSAHVEVPVEETVDEPDDEPQEVEEPDEPADEADDADDGPLSPLIGMPIDEDLLDSPVLQVKIENSPEARPQTGLDAADVVYEELVEGGITRFFAVFHSQLPESAGPVRSARPVDVHLMGGYGRSGFVFSGAREEVQSLMGATSAIPLSEGHRSLYRKPERNAPHNLYLDVEVASGAVAGRDPDQIDEVGWVFDEDAPDGQIACDDECETEPGEAIDVAMSYAFTTGWEYDADEGGYRRSQNGAPFDAAGDGEIIAANVVVLDTRHYISESGYPDTDLITDDAAALVLRDGKRYEARWKKPTIDAPITVMDLDGEPLPFKPGPTWVLLPDSI